MKYPIRIRFPTAKDYQLLKALCIVMSWELGKRVTIGKAIHIVVHNEITERKVHVPGWSP